jgi:hypothetical protein
MYIPELELPPTESLLAKSMSMANRPATRMPGLRAGDAGSASIATGRKEAAEQLADEMRIAYAISRAQAHQSKMQARKQNRDSQRRAEKRRLR